MQLTGPEVSLLIFLAVQGIAGLIWGAQMEIRMRAQEKATAKIGPMLDKMTRVQMDIRYMKRAIANIDKGVNGERRTFMPPDVDDEDAES